MGFQRVVGVGLLLWLGLSHMAMAASSPTEAVQRFVESVRQGRFAEAQSYLLDHVDVGSSLFGSWLFNSGSADANAATADVFFSRKFAEVFRYAVIDVANNGDSQAFVTAKRTTPHMGHLYTWALAPQRSALPYTLVEAIDTYLTKVNYPVEESQMQFTLVRELEDWYISAIHDEKFKGLREQIIAQPPLSTTPAAVSLAPPATPAAPLAQPPATTTSVNTGRQAADAQFHATMQGLNKAPQAAAAAVPTAQEKKGFFSRVGRVFGLGKKQDDGLITVQPGASRSSAVTNGQPAAPTGSATQTAAAAPSSTSEEQLRRRFKLIREALASYAGSNQSVPTTNDIYDWKSLRDVVNFHSRRSLPATESGAGFRFLSYRSLDLDNYVLLVQANLQDTGPTNLEVTPYGVEIAN
ncbi:MAG: hypothetical protein ETSY1_00690 [Candidatus Entotheonella factor]|uniref:Uncharacterized protein n=1 Tax=Entotheonella factor TaxID=1429438 RepID=W4LZQ4_ENTF1|nr:hypothetical protein [Candidatus Entotheonella palauensis]ETX03221.1 MAG: hypothetical protein ETSY1_00690 [Candidatus Entotheonella factor]